MVITQEFAHPGSRPADAAFNRSGRDAADSCSIVIRESFRSDEKQSLSLFRGQGGKSLLKVFQFEMRKLFRRGFQLAGIDAFRVRDLTAFFAIFRMEQISQDREKPGIEIGAQFEAVAVAPGTNESFLNQVVSLNGISAQRDGKRSELWQSSQNFLCEV